MSKPIAERVEAIEQRNKKVELDKAWETSWTRKLSIAILTYAVIAGFLEYIDNERPLIYALVPVIGFFLSTLILGRIKSFWQNKQ